MSLDLNKYSKVVVTGGAGFIGSEFTRRLVGQGVEVIVIDSLTYAGNLANLERVARGLKDFRKVDVVNETEVAKSIPENTPIVHFAAESHVDNSITNPGIAAQTNIIGTDVLLRVARQKNSPLFLQISTDEVYGSKDFGDSPSLETDLLIPSSPYSGSKAAAEMLCFGAMRTYKQPIMITRSSNNFGPFQNVEKMIPRSITNLLSGKPIYVFGEGKNSRDWIYVEDNCEAIETVMNFGRSGEVYNIGAGNEVMNIDLARTIAQRLGYPGKIEFVKDRPGHDVRYALNVDKIKSLGWKPRHNFEEALDKTIQWYQNNVEWWSVKDK